MTVDDFINNIEDLTQGVESNSPNNAWQFAAERLTSQLKQEIGPSNLANSLSYALQGNLISILANDYLLYQNYGVKGAEDDKSGANRDTFNNRTYAYGISMPPAGAFSEYSSDPSVRFAIAKSVYKYGIRPKSWFTEQSLADDYLRYANDFIQNNLI